MITGHMEIRGEVEVTEEGEEAVTPGATCAPSHSTDGDEKRTVKNSRTEGGFNCYEGLKKNLAAMETVKNVKKITEPLTKERIKAKERKEEYIRKGLEILADYQAEQSLSDSGGEEECEGLELELGKEEGNSERIKIQSGMHMRA